jgi:uncharacterized protein HemX
VPTLEERPHEAQTNERNPPLNKSSVELVGALALVLGVGLGVAGGWHARSGEGQEGQAATAALETDVQKARKNLHTALEDLEMAQDDLSSANSRASEAERGPSAPSSPTSRSGTC